MNPQKMRCRHPTVAGDNGSVLIHQHRVGKTESLDAVGDLSNLVLGVSSWVAWIKLELIDWLVGDGQIAKRVVGHESLLVLSPT
jgi:hypothetical protein